MNKKAICFILAAILVFIGSIVIWKGLDKKDNYFNIESVPSRSINAYVGGDAYNYIINGTYFAGYLSLGGALYVAASIFAVCGILAGSLESARPQKESDDDGYVCNKCGDTTPRYKDKCPSCGEYGTLIKLSDAMRDFNQ